MASIRISSPWLVRSSTRIVVPARYRSCRFARVHSAHRPSDVNLRTSRIPLSYVWYFLCLGIGASAGLSVKEFAKTRFFAPEPGSEQDELALRALSEQMERVKIVKDMRHEVPSTSSNFPLGQSKEAGGEWIELDMKKTMAETAAEGYHRPDMLTTTALGGIQGLGVQRAFWNTQTREVLALVWIGAKLSGWPGVAHGGAIAAMLQDAMARSIAGPNQHIESVPTPTSMSITYARPTFSFDLYVLRASFSKPHLAWDEHVQVAAPAESNLPSTKDMTKKEPSTVPQPCVEVTCTLEGLDSQVKVLAKGVWPASAVNLGNA